jgi:hypothetical protein
LYLITVGSSSFAWQREVVAAAQGSPPPKTVKTIRRVCISEKRRPGRARKSELLESEFPKSQMENVLIGWGISVEYIVANGTEAEFLQ